MSIKITAENFENVVLNSDKPVLVDFWATWCGPCKMIAPVVEEIAQEYEDKIVVAKIDVDEVPSVAAKYNVMSIPTLIVFENGKEVNRLVGFRPKAQIVAALGL
ncbi:MAG: thioredoxin [Oscillospiraceae bacterium]|nr:thioredoxin [Oscillospiraceae bacterium]MBP1552523.1 thioredoxin [Oscillospiraceae bacterium]MBP1571942.1 thioredoxin [Oscillospiraceae bacterium]